MSYTSNIEIERTGLYRLTSFGNGAAYSFERFGPNPPQAQAYREGVTCTKTTFH